MTTFSSSRKQAKLSGEKRYFTGKACVKGHIAPRKTNNGLCCECSNISTKTWRAQNPQKLSEYGAIYRAARGQSLLEKKREYQRDWNKKNKTEKRARDAAYESSKRLTRDKTFLAARANATKKYEAARIMRVPAWADHKAIEQMYELAQIFISVGVRMEVDHVVPLQGKTVSGLHTHENLQLMTRHKNASKSNRVWPDMP